MSDAIVLDVADTTPVRLDVGDADPIAREEIAELTTRVTTVEGDVSGLSTRVGAAESALSTLGTTVDGIDARVEAIEADYVTSEDVMGALGGEAPTLVSGSSRAMLGDAETASWMERTTAADGAALIESVRGNTVVQDGSLLPVRMEGVETVGFNQWDEVWEVGGININDGTDVAMANRIRGKNYIPVFPATTYFFGIPSSISGNVHFYDADRGFISQVYKYNETFTTPSNCRFIRFAIQPTYGTTYKNDICINLSDPSRNGTYEPHWSSQRTIPAATYFPDGLRSAGTVYDELTETQAITRVGSVDLGTLSWNYNPNFNGEPIFFIVPFSDAATPSSNNVVMMNCSGLTPVSANDLYVNATARNIISLNTLKGLQVRHDAADAAAFKAAMSGVMLHYALATPTTTPIDPPLPMSYRTGAGGTERVMVASGTTSAPPVFVTRYPLDPADLAASIAPVDGPTAEANHAVGDLVMLGWTLCKVTTAIARGEAITIGTNVTRTTVAAEITALS